MTCTPSCLACAKWNGIIGVLARQSQNQMLWRSIERYLTIHRREPVKA